MGRIKQILTARQEARHQQALYGIPVHLSAALKDGEVIMAGDGSHRPYVAMIVGDRPLSDLELWSAETRHQVRVGLADILEWCGEEVGPPPRRHGKGRDFLESLRGQG